MSCIDTRISEESDWRCKNWARNNQCTENTSFMSTNCAASCATFGTMVNDDCKSAQRFIGSIPISIDIQFTSWGESLGGIMGDFIERTQAKYTSPNDDTTTDLVFVPTAPGALSGLLRIKTKGGSVGSHAINDDGYITINAAGSGVLPSANFPSAINTTNLPTGVDLFYNSMSATADSYDITVQINSNGDGYSFTLNVEVQGRVELTGKMLTPDTASDLTMTASSSTNLTAECAVNNFVDKYRTSCNLAQWDRNCVNLPQSCADFNTWFKDNCVIQDTNTFHRNVQSRLGANNQNYADFVTCTRPPPRPPPPPPPPPNNCDPECDWWGKGGCEFQACRGCAQCQLQPVPDPDPGTAEYRNPNAPPELQTQCNLYNMGQQFYTHCGDYVGDDGTIIVPDNPPYDCRNDCATFRRDWWPQCAGSDGSDRGDISPTSIWGGIYNEMQQIPIYNGPQATRNAQVDLNKIAKMVSFCEEGH